MKVTDPEIQMTHVIVKSHDVRNLLATKNYLKDDILAIELTFMMDMKVTAYSDKQ